MILTAERQWMVAVAYEKAAADTIGVPRPSTCCICPQGKTVPHARSDSGQDRGHDSRQEGLLSCVSSVLSSQGFRLLA